MAQEQWLGCSQDIQSKQNEDVWFSCAWKFSTAVRFGKNVHSFHFWNLIFFFLLTPSLWIVFTYGPGLHATTNFTNSTIIRRFTPKNRGCSDFSRFTIFRYFFVFLTYHRGFPECNRFCENSEKSGPQQFFALYDFSLLLVCLTNQNGFRIQQILRKLRKTVVAAICCT